MSKQAVEIIANVPRIARVWAIRFNYDRQDTDQRLFQGKATIDEAMLRIAQKDAKARGTEDGEIRISNWTLHDLRRTAASGMARIGIDLPVIEKISITSPDPSGELSVCISAMNSLTSDAWHSKPGRASSTSWCSERQRATL